MKSPDTKPVQQSFLAAALNRMVVIRAFQVAIIVGTVLVFINHGEKVLNMSFSGSDWFKVMLTYIVPYCVSTWSAVRTMQGNT